MTKETENFFG